MKFIQKNEKVRKVVNTFNKSHPTASASWKSKFLHILFGTIIGGMALGIVGNWIANYYQNNFNTVWEQIVRPAWQSNSEE